jgi:hypothetical protein
MLRHVAFTASVVAALAGAAAGDVVLTGADTNVLQTNLTMTMGGTGSSDAVLRRYDEWTPAAAGTSALTSIFTTGAQEIADDLTFAPQVGVGQLNTLGFAVANSIGPAGSSFTGGQVRIAFYDLTTGLAIPSINGFTGFTANLPVLALAPGGSSRINFPAGGLTALGWYFDNRPGVYASLKFNTVTGTGGFILDHAGMQTRNGGTIGSSTDQLVGVTTGPQPTGFFSFGGTPFADSAWFIDTDSVPAPGSIALLGMGGLIAFRRRRS